MAIRPDTWSEEDRETFAEEIASKILEEMSLKDLHNFVWDQLFEDLMNRPWVDLWMEAEEYAPHLVEKFTSPESREAQRGSY